tara:strand:- start:582 stop:1862 length:1281 start_codon:yes stop_codon:yes gene_type:complete
MKEKIWLLFLCLLPLLVIAEGDKAETFASSSSVSNTIFQINKLPTDDIWWNIYGKDQLWNFKNANRFLPTVHVHRRGDVSNLKSRINKEIANMVVDTPIGKKTFKTFLDNPVSTTMSLVILYRGDIVFEYYPHQEDYEKPIYWSVTKIIVSTLIGILEEEGLVDITKPVSNYIKDLKNSSYGRITIENLLNMASGFDCADNYFDRSSCYYRYSSAIGDGYWTEESPYNPYHFVASLEPKVIAPQGTKYQYSGIDTFVLGWLIETVLGMPLQDAITKKIWMKIGAEADGLMIAPRNGIPVIHGGLMIRPRDAARFGLLFTPSYKKVASSRLVSESFIKRISFIPSNLQFDKRKQSQNGELFAHSAYQWDAIFSNSDYFKGGWAGQGILVNPQKDLVAVYTGYAIDDNESQPDLLPILRQLLNHIYPS